MKTEKITRKEMKKLVNFGRLEDGTVFVASVKGDVHGDVGSIVGSVVGSVDGDVKGSVGGSVGGDVEGNVRGNVGGSVDGDIWDDIEGYARRCQNTDGGNKGKIDSITVSYFPET